MCETGENVPRVSTKGDVVYDCLFYVGEVFDGPYADAVSIVVEACPVSRNY